MGNSKPPKFEVGEYCRTRHTRKPVKVIGETDEYMGTFYECLFASGAVCLVLNTKLKKNRLTREELKAMQVAEVKHLLKGTRAPLPPGFVFDPSQINLQDVLNAGPGKIIRINKP